MQPGPGRDAVDDPRWIDALANVLLAGAAIVCGWFGAAGPHLHDTGELTVAAVELGGSHPPGQPLHALLGHAFVLLPLGPIAGRVALLSGLCAIAAAALAGWLAAELAVAFDVRTARATAWCRVVAGLGTLLALPVLRQSLRVEVYTLALALFLGSALCLLRWARSGRGTELWAAAWLAGLAFSVHPPHALAAALLAGCLALPQLRRLLATPRVWLGAFAFGGMALLVLLYLPLRARAGASMWGEPQSWGGFVRYVTGHAYLSPDEQHHAYFASLGDYLGYFVRITWGAPLLGSLWLLVARKDSSRPIALGLGLAIAAAFAATCLQPLEPRNPDNVAYLGPGLVLCLAAGSAGFAALYELGPRTLRVLAVLGSAAIALPPPSLPQIPVQLRADLPALETLSTLLLDAPPRALVVATGEVAISAWMLGQSVDRVRPDAALFVPGLATSSWHWARLRAQPGLDGKPRRAAGSDAHDRYTRGAVLGALARVPVLLERALPGLPPTSIRGAYLLLDDSGPAQTPSYAWSAIAERSTDALARDAAVGPDGDEQEAASAVRAYLGVRSRRLLQLGHARRALQGIALALWDLPASERAVIRAERDVPVPRLPQFIDDPASLHSSRGDAERQAAAELWVIGERTRARTLLDRQLKSGDPRALLQLASLFAYDGEYMAALKVLADFEHAVPELRAESSAVRARLAQPR
ncbi:MAG TPA: DUF2723 domain-containing protein [Polyangiales bacterium]|nr:DUF2723 domain-containing protein [Polyangiales bacterium]